MKQTKFLPICIMVSLLISLHFPVVYAVDNYDITITVIADGEPYTTAITHSVTSDGRFVTIAFNPTLPDDVCSIVTFSGAIEGSIALRTFVGDTNRDGQVTGPDTSDLNPLLGQDVDEGSYHLDVDTSGIIDEIDIEIIEQKIGRLGPADCGSHSGSIKYVWSCQYHGATEYCLNLTDNTIEPRYPGINKIKLELSEPLPPVLYLEAPSSISEGATFKVTVTSNDDPVGDASVMFNGMTKPTGSDGKASFTAPLVSKSTPYSIIVEKQGFISDETTLLVEDVEAPPLPSLEIFAPETVEEGEWFTVYVKVDEEAIADVTVYFSDQIEITNSEGKVQLQASSVATPSAFTIRASKDWYQSDTEILLVNPTDDTAEIGYIYGVVYASTGEVLEDATICIIHPQTKMIHLCTTTDSQGGYVASLSGGTYDVSSSLFGYQTMSTSIHVTTNEALQVNFILEPYPFVSETTDTGFNEYIIQTAAEKGLAGAKITIDTASAPTIDSFSEDVKVVLSEQIIDSYSFMVSADDDTSAKLFFFEMDAQVFTSLNDLNDLTIYYDFEKIGQVPFLQLLQSDVSMDASWAGIITLDENNGEKLFIAFFIPHFSDHTITISAVSILQDVGVLMIGGVYAFICIIGLVFFFLPAYTGAYYPIFFRRRRKP